MERKIQAIAVQLASHSWCSAGDPAIAMRRTALTGCRTHVLGFRGAGLNLGSLERPSSGGASLNGGATNPRRACYFGHVAAGFLRALWARAWARALWCRALASAGMVLAASAFAQTEQPGRQSSQRDLARPQSQFRQHRVRMDELHVTSPDGRIQITVLPNAARLSYTVQMEGATVVEPSALRFFVDGLDLTSGVVLSNVSRYAIHETYRWRGPKTNAINHCNGALLALEHDLSSTAYTLELRAYNDGVAYRFIAPAPDEVARVPDEYSEFVLPTGTTVWYHDLSSHYEGEYVAAEISTIKAGQWAGPPVTLRFPEGRGYGSIMEANLVNYSGMALEADGRRGWITGLGHRHPLNYPFELRYGRDEARRLAKPEPVRGTITTPWRVILVSRDLNALVNSTLLPNLCPPPNAKFFPDGLDTSWVEPGLAVWDYLDRNYAADAPTNLIERMKYFSCLAGKLGFKYHVLEGFAYHWSDNEIREFAEYSRAQGVRVLFWRHSRSLRTPEAREEFFGRLRRLGVAGAKIDFIDHEAKECVDLYEAILEKAAEHRCVVVFHGANKPTGRQRTWPNELAREAVRGMEYRRLYARARHNTILPFTRCLAGPADYTPLHFGERRGDTTWAHQIASAVVFSGPLVTLAAHPRSILDNPAVELIKSIRPVWDETVVLPGSRIGELVIFARRSGQMWMLAVMCGPRPQEVHVPLSFLAPGRYTALIASDADDSSSGIKVEARALRSGESLFLRLASGGGFIARFVPSD